MQKHTGVKLFHCSCGKQFTRRPTLKKHQLVCRTLKIAFLQFLSVWLESSSPSITQFLSNSNSIPYLITQITSGDSEDKEVFISGLSAFVLGLCLYFNPDTVPAFAKENLVQLITNRIGIETLTDALNHISKSEYYLHSLKHPQINAKHSSDLLFDHSFCLLFKKYEPLILLQLNNPNGHPHHMTPASAAGDWGFSKMGGNYMANNHQSPNDLINRYKEVIRTQDEDIEDHKKEISELQLTNVEYKTKLEELSGEIMQLKSQLALAQAQSMHNVRQIPEDQHVSIVSAKDNQIKQLEEKIASLNQSFGGGLPSVKFSMQEEVIAKLEEENKQLVEEVERMKKDQEELLELLTEQDNRISDYKGRLRDLGAQVAEDEDAEDELVPANMQAFDENNGEEDGLL